MMLGFVMGDAPIPFRPLHWFSAIPPVFVPAPLLRFSYVPSPGMAATPRGPVCDLLADRPDLAHGVEVAAAVEDDDVAVAMRVPMLDLATPAARHRDGDEDEDDGEEGEEDGDRPVRPATQPPPISSPPGNMNT